MDLQEITLYAAIILIIGFLSTSFLTDKIGAEKTLIDAGYTPVSVGGHNYFGCSNELWATRFTAKSIDSTTIVKGCVCRGIWKGSTIRFH